MAGSCRRSDRRRTARDADPVLRADPKASRKGGARGCRKELPDLTQQLLDCGAYKQYAAWRDGYRRWRQGRAGGAHGEATALKPLGQEMVAPTTTPTVSQHATWRDDYRRWREGFAAGAKGEATAAALLGAAAPLVGASVVFDVIADEAGEPALLPVGGPPTASLPVKDLPGGALVTIRVFRFFETRSDEEHVWERELRNVNSGSILWLPVHLAPKLHSVAGAKYGTWFTIHYLRVYARHFKSNYHMCNDGCSYPAKTFGCTSANTSVVSGAVLPRGYFWYVSPDTQAAESPSGSGDIGSASGVEAEPRLREGWQHLGRAGPFDGSAFLAEWRRQGSPMEERRLQAVLDHLAVAPAANAGG